jgi:hypothetical protein
MLLPKHNTQHWRLLTRDNIALRRVFPWGRSIQNILWQAQPVPFVRQDLFIASDYGGEHKAASHLVYAFLAVDTSPSNWPAAIKRIRASILTGGRRMSFKRLNDPARRDALVPFLEAADTLTGHLIVVAVDKRIKWLVTRKGDAIRWKRALSLKSQWTDHAFENMGRKAYIIALLLSIWSRPMMNIDWITDQDQAVANADRLSDAHIFAATMSSLLLPHNMGEFSLNSTEIDGADRILEDFCALPDLAAGMASDICSALATKGSWETSRRYELEADAVSSKAGLISDWFWESKLRLHKTMIQMDSVRTGYTVRQVWRM